MAEPIQPKIGNQASPEKKEVAKEIERKFLVKSLPENLEQYPHKEIKQGYVLIGEDGSEVRLRAKGDKYFQTIKSGKGKVRNEAEIALTEEQFNQMWPSVEGRIVDKTRYEIPYKENTIELDVYHGNLNGLISAEVEFKSEKDSDDFIAPDWFGDEVTEDKRYKNQNLALYGKPEQEQKEVAITIEKQEFGKEVPKYNLEKGVSRIIEKVQEKREQSDKPIMVLIAGSSASGKTSMVAKKVRERFGDDAAIFSLDDYYRDRDYILGNGLNFDQPEALKMDMVRKHLEELKQGKDVTDRPVFSFQTGKAEGVQTFPAKPIIIVEGLFALNDIVEDLGDIKAFVDVSAHGRIIRRIVRDEKDRGFRPADNISYMLSSVEPMYDKYIEPTKDKAEMIITNDFEPKLETEKIAQRERQIKFKGTLNDNQLRDLGATHLGVVEQQDAYFNPQGKDLLSSDEILRVRKQNNEFSFTYKGPKVESEVRERPVYEFKIDKDTAESFLNIYGKAVTIIKKKRELYSLPNGLTIALDHVVKDDKDLGDFTEFRSTTGGVSDIEMKKIEELLGFNPEKGIKESYFEM